jgi:hypothetical protein
MMTMPAAFRAAMWHGLVRQPVQAQISVPLDIDAADVKCSQMAASAAATLTRCVRGHARGLVGGEQETTGCIVYGQRSHLSTLGSPPEPVTSDAG